jgi:REP element-mobilizing transposase RayT
VKFLHTLQTGLELCRKCRWKHIKVGSSWQKFQRAEGAAVIVPVMGRFNRVVAVDVPHHITQRGNGRRFILDCDADRAVYLKLLHENMDLHGVALIGYCLMSNHVHLVAIPTKGEGLAEALKQIHGRYACYWNVAHQSSGHVWQGRYYPCPLDETHLWEALRYTELNPLGLVWSPSQNFGPGQAPPFTAAPTSTMRSWLSMRGAATGPSPLGESTSEKGKWNPSWRSFVNEPTQGDRWELQSLFKILRKPRGGS